MIDLIAIEERIEEAKPTTIITNIFDDSIMYIWDLGKDRVIQLAFFMYNDKLVGRFDISDDDLCIKDCSSIVDNTMDLLIEMSDALEYIETFCSMPVQAQLQIITDTIDELIQEEG